MPLLRNVASGMRSLFRKKRAERDLDEELRAFMEMATEESMKQGRSQNEALRGVRLEHGSLEAAREAVRTAGWESVPETFWQDVRYGLRMLSTSPGFAAVAILTLALGIGANTAIFSMVKGILLSALPYPHPEQLYSVNEVIPQWSGFAPILPANSGNFLLWKSRCDAFADMAALLVYPYNMTGVGLPRQVYVAQVSAEFFSLMGVQPRFGRLFPPAAEAHGQSGEIVVTEQFWEQVFHSDPEIMGKPVSLNGSPYTVAGVLPSSFRFPEVFGHEPELFMPLELRGLDLVPGIGNFNYTVIARETKR